MSEIEKEKIHNQFNGVMICIIGAMVIISCLFAKTVWQVALGVVVGLPIAVCGIWLVQTNKVYWSVSDGFTPKEHGSVYSRCSSKQRNLHGSSWRNLQGLSSEERSRRRRGRQQVGGPIEAAMA
jgi:hypothetical protein